MYRNYKDLIAAIAAGIPGETTPPLFREWVALGAVSAALGRKVWFEQGQYDCYANLYIILVGKPATGKGVAIDFAYEQLLGQLCESLGENEDESEAVKTAYKRYIRDDWNYPLHMLGGKSTYEKLVANMKRFSTQVVDAKHVDGKVRASYPSANIVVKVPEFGTFMDRHFKDLHMLLTEGWDSSANHEYHTKNAKVFILKGPTIQWIAGATPSEFVLRMPPNAKEQGLLTRTICVYEKEFTGHVLAKTAKPKLDFMEDLRQDLGLIAGMKGEFTFEPDMQEHAQAGLDDGQKPRPTDPFMDDYNGRRYSQLLKTSMCYAAARRPDYVIKREDWDSACKILFATEVNMPDLFSKIGISDTGKLAEELVDVVRAKRQIPKRVLKRIALKKAKNIADVDNTINALISTGALKEDDAMISMGVGI